MKITFLGTACMQPTKERNHQGILVTHGSENMLFDCGEGIQRQMKIEGVKPAKITRLIISHWHGDHVLGIPGLVQTMGASEYEGKLHIYGPKGTKKYIEHMLEAFLSSGCIDFEVHEVEKGVFLDTSEFYVESMPLEHGVACNGYRIVEKDKRRINLQFVKKLGIPDGPILGKLQSGKNSEWAGKEVKADDATYIVPGKKVAIVLDTMVCENAVILAKDTDILICESVYMAKHKDKAEEYNHLTVQDAAMIATQAGAKKLILTHFSQRYKDVSEIQQEAESFFSDVICAYDFMKVKV